VRAGSSPLLTGSTDSFHWDSELVDRFEARVYRETMSLGERAAQVTWIESDVLTAPLPSAHYGV
jgi:hypothetical protein